MTAQADKSKCHLIPTCGFRPPPAIASKYKRVFKIDLEPVDYCGELDQSQEGLGDLVIADADATEALDSAEKVFEPMAQSVTTN